MNFLRVEGSYYEMGFKQGEFFANDIRTSFVRLIRSKSIKSIKPPLVPTFVFGQLLKHLLYRKWKKAIEILLPEYSQRIKGIAEGAKVDLSDLYVIQSIEVMADDVRYFVEKSEVATTAAIKRCDFLIFGCSSICVLQNVIRSPQMIVGKNFDYLNDFSSDHLVRISKPRNGYKSIEITYKQIAGAHDGMNEKGLVVLYNYGLSTEKTQIRIPITILVQQLLERCSSVEEAIMFIKSFRYPNGAIITLADSSNRAVCVELTPEHIGFRKPEDGVLIATNFYLSEDVRKFDIPHNARFRSRGISKNLQGKRVHQSSEQRYYRMLELTKKIVRFDIEDVENILKDHNGKPIGDDDTICRHGEFLSTQIGVIFLPKVRKVRVYYGTPCRKNTYEYELD
ncbi:MAG: C45 family peptidase [Endomicrobia bacterium]|nr:C45 family peptidase [Endomicrobiia bacterium]MDW8055838.1 C45 family peptidase [Elusimicrobiota bacterium]